MKIGIDIASITRIAKSYERLGAAFLSKFLRKSEIKILRKNSQSIAGFWAAKEAASRLCAAVLASIAALKILKSQKTKKVLRF